MESLQQLKTHKYINLETFRKSGVGVRTPVWFVQTGDALYVRTVANSGKVKRIRRRAAVNIAVCKVDGALLGDWLPASARELVDPETAAKVDRMLDQKYGLLKKMFAAASRLQGHKYTVLEIMLTKEKHAQSIP
jgi:uncharacterized protein